MAEVSFLEPYKNLLVSDDVISGANELDLAVLPLYDESDAKYYHNIIEGFCRMQEYTHFWKTIKLLRNQIFVLSKKCDLSNENVLFPKNSLVFPISLLDPLRSCMTPRFPSVRFKNLDGTVSYIIRLADLTTWGNATDQCSGTIFAQNSVDTAPVPVPAIVNGTAVHWRTGDYLPKYMADARFFLDEARFNIGGEHGIETFDFSSSTDSGFHYNVVITVNKLQLGDSVLRESYGVACIGSFCLESPKIAESNRIVKVYDGTYMVILSSTGQDSLERLQISLARDSIKLLRAAPVLPAQTGRMGIAAEVLDSVALNGSLYHVGIVTGPNTPGSMLPSKQVELKIALRSSESVEPLPVKDFMIQDSIASFENSDIMEILRYGYNHYMTPSHGAQLLRLPVECFSNTASCATPQHIRLAMHVVTLIVLFITGVVIIPVYIIGKWIAIRRLKAAAQKQENNTGITLCHSVTKAPKSALKEVVRESQRMYAAHLDRKRKALKTAISGTEPISLRDVSAILDVFPLGQQ